MSLVDTLHFRYPIVWAHTMESERLIIQLSYLLDDRDFYVFDEFDGLTVWDKNAEDFKIILILKPLPFSEDGEMVETPIKDFGEALMYAYDAGSEAVFAIRNFHKGADNFLNPLASIYNKFYRSFRFDDIDACPLTVLCLSTEAEVPSEIAAITAVTNFGLPTESEVVELLTYLNSKVPVEQLVENDDIVSLAQACRGMSEFDIVNTIFGIVKEKGVVSGDEVERLKYERLKASSTLDIVKPRHNMDAIGGLDQAKQLILDAHWIRTHPEEAKAKKLQPLNKILFLGVPGCGKSFISEAASATLGLDLAKVGVAKAMNKFVGESERRMRETFTQINALAPIAVWIDELGRDFQGGNFDSGTTQRVHGELLTGLQELPDNVALFAAANDISSLPPEMLRAERFDKILFVGFPSFAEREDIFRINLDPTDEYDYSQLAAATEFFTGAEIVQLLKEARLAHMRSASPLSTKDILGVKDHLRNRLWIRYKPQMMQMYREAYDQHEWASNAQRAEAGAVLNGQSSLSGSANRGFVVKS